MHALSTRPRRLVSTLALALALAATGCGGPVTAQGLSAPPPDLDPNSPKLVARNIEFDRRELRVPALRPFVIVFENADTVPHNVSLYADVEHKDRRFEGLVFNGPGKGWYPVPALPPGSYTFVCDLHPIPSMIGTLVVS